MRARFGTYKRTRVYSYYKAPMTIADVLVCLSPTHVSVYKLNYLIPGIIYYCRSVEKVIYKVIYIHEPHICIDHFFLYTD